MQTKAFKQVGVTLIELMIVVVIVGILAAIAYPSYRNYMVQTRRSDAHIALTQAATQQERFFTECNYYAKTLGGASRSCGSPQIYDNGTLGLSATSPEGHYALSLVAANSSSTAFELVADPNAAAAPQRQLNDGKFKIDSLGRKFWDKNNDNDYADAGENSWQK